MILGARNFIVLLLVIFSFAQIPAARPTWAASPELIEQAKKEGEAVLYTTMPVGEFQIFNQAAKEKYPFLNVRHVRINSGSQVSKVMLEHKAGKIQVDVIGNNLAAMRYFKEQGVLAKVESPEIGQLVKGSADPDGFWAGITSEFYITAYNTKMLQADKAPRSFDDYLEARFKDQLAVNRGVPDGLIGMLELRGEDKGMAYMRRLGRQGLRPVDGFTHMTNLLVAGEYPVALFMQVSKIDAMKKKGAPVNWSATTPTITTISCVGVTKNAAHPAAAKLLMDFYLSADGQRALTRAGKIPARRGIKSPSEDIDRLLDSQNLHVLRTEGDYSRYMKLYNEVLAMR
jgi:ABC-type Fe3+ transport system substrate-binding protein